MFIHDWKKEVFTIPNLLSIFRLLLIPVYMTVYLNAEGPTDCFLAGSILAVSCLTDTVDGRIARQFHMVSNLGKLLDPLADKATQFTLTLCLSVRYPALRPVLALFVVKELFQAGAGLFHLRRGRMLSGALVPGKICTAVLFVSLILLVVLPDPEGRFVTAIAVTDFCFLSWSFCAYLLAYLSGRHLQDL